MSLVLTIMGRFLKPEVCVELASKELPGTRIARCHQLQNKDLVLGENCKSVFDLISAEPKSKILNGAKELL